MSAILNEYEASKPALRRYLGRFFARSQDVDDMRQDPAQPVLEQRRLAGHPPAAQAKPEAAENDAGDMQVFQGEIAHRAASFREMSARWLR